MARSGAYLDDTGYLRSYQKEDLTVFSLKTIVVAAALSAGVALAMPAASQAMPASAPVKTQAAKDGNIIDVRHYYRHRYRYHRYRGYYPYRRYGHYRYRHYYPYYYPYYGYYEPYPYYGYYGGYYGPGFYGPGIGFSLHF